MDCWEQDVLGLICKMAKPTSLLVWIMRVLIHSKQQNYPELRSFTLNLAFLITYQSSLITSPISSWSKVKFGNIDKKIEELQAKVALRYDPCTQQTFSVDHALLEDLILKQKIL